MLGLPASSQAELSPLQVALRHKWMILLFAFLVAAAVYGGLKFVTPAYVAEADVRIDMQPLHVMNDTTSLLPSQTPTLEFLRTEMAVLMSPQLAQSAAAAMKLTDMREFQICPPVTRLDSLRALLGRLRGEPAAPPAACESSLENAGKALLGRMTFSNDRTSFIIQIGATASDPALAAKLANGYAAAYVDWQQKAKTDLADDADAWLSTDLARMHDRVLASDAAVESYRQSHHLIGLHVNGVAGDGSQQPIDTVNAQRLEQLNVELGAITAQLLDKQSTLSQVEAALQSGQLQGIAPALNSPTVQGMVIRQADLASNLAQLRANYGPNYPTVAAAAAAAARGEASIRVEAEKAVHGLTSEVAALSARKAAVAAQVSAFEGRVAGESEAGVTLTELQREAQSNRTIYESMFIRLKQVEAERRLVGGDAAVVVQALPPDVPSYPRKVMMVSGAFLASLGIGTGLAFAHQMTSSRFRDAEQIESEIGLPVMGLFAKARRAPQDIVIDRPMSVEAESVHATLTQMFGRSGMASAGTVVLVTSAVPREGKSSFCVALGRSALQSGRSAFILDCDLRRPSIARLLAGGKRTQALAVDTPARDQEEMIAEIMRQAGVDERSGLRYLSLGDYVSNPHGLLAWPGLPAAVAYLRSRYDLILLDTPPVLAVSDALKLGGLADKVLFMIDWTETPRQAVAAAVRALQRAQVTVAGAVLSKVDLRRYARASRGDGFYLREYTQYHQAIDRVG
jgi:uncharacterized protein involved in exopolysaccharide biosynthesis